MNTKDKVILSLDPSSTHIGYCLSRGGDYRSSGCYTPKAKGAEERLHLIINWTMTTILAHRPDILIMEEPAGDHGSRKIDRLLARVGGAIEAAAVLSGGIERIIRVYPTQVKATHISKDNLLFASRVIGKDLSADEADAIGVLYAGLKKLGYG